MSEDRWVWVVHRGDRVIGVYESYNAAMDKTWTIVSTDGNILDEHWEVVKIYGDLLSEVIYQTDVETISIKEWKVEKYGVEGI